MTAIVISPKSQRILVELLRKEIQRLAFDAYAFEIFGINTPVGRSNSERRRLLKTALEELQVKETHEQTDHPIR